MNMHIKFESPHLVIWLYKAMHGWMEDGWMGGWVVDGWVVDGWVDG